MKKLIMLSIFALGTVSSFAGNGETEIASKEFSSVSSDLNEEFSNGDLYRIDIKITWTCSGGLANSSFKTAIEQTACLDATQLASVKSMYLMLYQTMYPDVCNVEVYEHFIDSCL